MDRSIIKVSNIWIESLFEWFFENVMDHCGDGDGFIVCKNYREAADMFEEWWKKNKTSFDTLEKTVDNDHNEVFYHRGQESWTFTNDKDFKSFPFDYVFIVESECISSRDKNKKIIGVDNEG